MKTYVLDLNLEIVLYGFNRYSLELMRKLKEYSYKEISFIDRRANELRCSEEIQVYTVENISQYVDVNHACVIIMLQNALQHDAIAANLYKLGFEKIIFVPMQQKYNIGIANKFRCLYNLLLLGEISDVKEIPFYNALFLEDKKAKLEILDQSKNYLIVRAICDIVYTNPVSAVGGKRNLLKYADIPLSAYKPYNELFMYLQGEGGELEEYLQDYGVNSCNYTNSYVNNDIIVQREKLYEVWNEHFQEGLEFFVSSAPLAEWNKNGYFNLLEGQHRTLFLLKKGVYYLPIRISRVDWEKWQNTKRVRQLNNIINTSVLGISPVQNPYFQESSFYNKVSIINSMLNIQQKIARDLYYGKKILAIDEMLGYYGINLCRMGAKSVTLYAENFSQEEIIQSLIDLYGLEKISIEKQINWEEINQFSFISVIGENNIIKAIKNELLHLFSKIEVKTVLISMTKGEYELVDGELKQRLTIISRVFLEGEMIDIYLLNRDS